jgi:hypothetical protein
MMDTYPVEPENFLDEAIADPSAPPAVNDDYVCERCANIPWKNLATRSNLYDEIISVIDSRLSLLDEARCRICRLLAQAILTHSIFYNKSFMLRRCDTTMFNILHCRGLFLDCCNFHDTESIISCIHVLANPAPSHAELKTTSRGWNLHAKVSITKIGWSNHHRYFVKYYRNQNCTCSYHECDLCSDTRWFHQFVRLDLLLPSDDIRESRVAHEVLEKYITCLRLFCKHNKTFKARKRLRNILYFCASGADV